MSRQKEFKWQKRRTANYKGNSTYKHKLINFPLYDIVFYSFISEKTNSRRYEFNNAYGKNIYYDNIDDCIKQVLKSFINKAIDKDYLRVYCNTRFGYFSESSRYDNSMLSRYLRRDYEITAARHKKRFIHLYQKLYATEKNK